MNGDCHAFNSQVPEVGTRVKYTEGVDAKKGKPKAGNVHPADEGGSRNSKEQWTCKLCGFKNRPSNSVCGGKTGTLGCKAAREDAGGGSNKPKGDKWQCGSCGFFNKQAIQFAAAVAVLDANSRGPYN